MPEDTIEEILGEVCRRSHQAKGTDSYFSLVDEATARIKALMLECVGEDKEIVRHRDHDKLIREYEGYNQRGQEIRERIIKL